MPDRKVFVGGGLRANRCAMWCAVIGCVTVASSSSAQDARFVDHATSGTPTGLSWAAAWPSPQSALDAVLETDNWQVLVAEGVYTPTALRDSGEPRSATFFIDTNIKFFGGFESGVGVDYKDADPVAFPTTLSGDIGVQADPADNAYHVLIIRDVTSSTVIDGFTIRDGYANGMGAFPEPGSWGGGILVVSAEFKPPAESVAPVIQNCIIEWNVASAHGGGIAAYGETGNFPGEEIVDAQPIVQATIIRNNLADAGLQSSLSTGGGLFTNSEAFLVNCLFHANTARFEGGAIDVEIGGVLRMNGCTVTENTLLLYQPPVTGGGCDTRTAGVRTNDVGEPDPTRDPPRTSRILNSIFWGNRDTDPANDHRMQEQLWVVLSTCESQAQQGGITEPTEFLELHHSCVENLRVFANGNIDDDPLFVDPANEDYRLQYGSPAIDTGSVNPLTSKAWDDFPLDRFDIDRDGIRDGDPMDPSVPSEYAPDLRPIDRVYPAVAPQWPIDMGAYEFRCPFDLDVDGEVGAEDLAILLGAWGPCEGRCPADLDGNGEVGAPDLAILLGAWGGPGECDTDVPLPSPPVGLLAALGEGVGASSASAPSGLAPIELAELFGFDSLASFSAWLASLPAAQREAVLAMLSAEAEGGF